MNARASIVGRYSFMTLKTANDQGKNAKQVLALLAKFRDPSTALGMTKVKRRAEQWAPANHWSEPPT